MPACKELFQGNEIAQRLTHFLAVDGNHVVVHPITARHFAVGRHRLGNFRFVVRKEQIHATPVDIELLPEIFARHGRTFGMPPRKTVAPRRRPTHDMFGRSLFPKRKIQWTGLFVLRRKVGARGGQQVFYHPAGELAVVVLLVVFSYIEIDRTIGFVSVAGGQNFLYHLNLFDDMTARVRLYRRPLHAQLIHIVVVAVGVVLRHLHRFQLFQAGFLGNFVFALVGILFQMPHVGNVAHIAHLVAQMLQIAKQEVEGNPRPGMAQMRVAIDRGAAHIHTHLRGMQGFKQLFAPMQRIVEHQLIFHHYVRFIFSKRVIYRSGMAEAAKPTAKVIRPTKRVSPHCQATG